MRKGHLHAQVPGTCAGVPDEILNPANQWSNKGEFDKTLGHLATLYQVTLILILSSLSC